MAIFRAETKHITRSKKHNVVAAAAYRAGEKLTDTNKFNPNSATHDYSKKQGVVATGIILPRSLIAQNFAISRQELWSNVEQSETTTRSVKGSRLKQSARLAREWLLALPSELSDDENEQLTREFTTKLVNDLGVIADFAIHKPSSDDIKPKKMVGDDDKRTPVAPDKRNIHAHIIFTTRKAELNTANELIFTDKADSERSEKWRQEQKLGNGGDYLKEIRELWADMLNQRLEQKNILPVTAKSYAELGLDIIPQAKNGKNATVMSRFHLNNEQTTAKKGHNNDIKQRNRAVIKSAASSSTNKSSSQITFAASSCYDSVTSRDERKRAVDERESALNTTVVTVSHTVKQRALIRATDRKIAETDSRIDEADRKIGDRESAINSRARIISDSSEFSRARNERIKQREQLISDDISNARQAESGIKAASNCYERNLTTVASRLAWYKEHSIKYDERQLKQLDTFYKTLNIPNLTFEMSKEDYIQPTMWSEVVKKVLTDKHIIENQHIVAIVLDQASEKAIYDAKTSQSIINQKVALDTIIDNKASNTAAQTHIATNNNKRRP